jgi:integrating conjugative element protein (TIGR03759 family)
MKRAALLLCAMICMPLATAQTSTAQSRETASPFAPLDEKRLAAQWGLQTEEWARFRELMQGPLGTYSPGLDPLSALGIEARDEAERRRYAEMQARAEARRVEKLLIYQRAYDEAFQRIFAQLPRIASAHDETGPRRLAVFVKADCLPCENRVKQLQAAGTDFDLYFVDATQDDTRLRQWAKKTGIDPKKVRAGAITLNHDDGRWQSLGVTGDLPAIVREVDGRWQRQ